jgi:hypothetical protein
MLELKTPLMTPTSGSYEEIQELDVNEALKMEGGRALRPDGVPIEVRRCLGDMAIVWLTKLLNRTGVKKASQPHFLVNEMRCSKSG